MNLHFKKALPLSLYIHLPWCVKKCPYCDFNSHALKTKIPEAEYIACLRKDLEEDLLWVQDREIISIFFGGGTPSLFSAQSFDYLLNHLFQKLSFSPNIEITLEANPGTLEHTNFNDYRNAGFNRISLGAQSFQDDKLERLGRIHKSLEIKQALEAIQKADFKSFNIDLMYGLPDQSLSDAMFDLETALGFNPPHLSWYNLTLEPNTAYYLTPPQLPSDEKIWDILNQGQTLLNKHYEHYEVSAYAKPGFACQHNVNYWEFGDYLGLGAGAHAKITDIQNNQVIRLNKIRHPTLYLKADKTFIAGTQILSPEDLRFEFMLNRLRLSKNFDIKLFEERTGLPFTYTEEIVNKAITQNLLTLNNHFLQTTELGKRFLNNLVEMFLNNTP